MTRVSFVAVVSLLTAMPSAAAGERSKSGGSVWLATDSALFELDPDSAKWNRRLADTPGPVEVATYGEAGLVWAWDGETLWQRSARKSWRFEAQPSELGCLDPVLAATEAGNLLSICPDYVSLWQPNGDLLWQWTPPLPIEGFHLSDRILELGAAELSWALDVLDGTEVESVVSESAKDLGRCLDRLSGFSRTESDPPSDPLASEAGSDESSEFCARRDSSLLVAFDPRDASKWSVVESSLSHRPSAGGEESRFPLPGRGKPRRLVFELRPSPLEPQSVSNEAVPALDESKAPDDQSRVAALASVGPDEVAITGQTLLRYNLGAPGPATATVMIPSLPSTTVDSTGYFATPSWSDSVGDEVMVVARRSTNLGEAIAHGYRSVTPGSISDIGGITYRYLCPTMISPGMFPANDLNGDVRAMVVFDDGSGPAVFVGGTFTTARGVTVNRVAKWNGASWSPLSSGFTGKSSPSVDALTIFDDGTGPRLFAGGKFTKSGAASVNYVAKWTGSSWVQVGSSLGGQVLALVSHNAGGGARLVAGGAFTKSGTTVLNRIAQLSGSSWSPLGSGFNGTVRALASYSSGIGPRLVAGGTFTSAGGSAANRIAAWDNSAWSPLGAGVTGGSNPQVNALHVRAEYAGTFLYVGGKFTTAGPSSSSHAARWDGVIWQSIATDLGPEVLALASWDDGTGWSLYAGGSFTTINGEPQNRIARLAGQYWEPVGTGANGTIFAMASGDVGGGSSLFLGGAFTSVDGVVSTKIARLNRASSCPDAAYPVLDFVEPRPNKVTTSTRPLIRLAAVDLGVGIDWNSVSISRSGSPIAVECAPSDPFVDCVLTQDLSAGWVSLTAYIRDLAGNLSSYASVPFQIPDFVIPTISILTPGEGEVVADRRPEIQIEYSDIGVGVNTATLGVGIDGFSTTFDCIKGATGATCVPRSPLPMGAATVQATIRDFQSNLSIPAVRSFIVNTTSTTSFVGAVRRSDGSPAVGAKVWIQEQAANAVTVTADGSFTLAGVDLLGALPVALVAKLTSGGANYLGFTGSISPTVGGVTEVGTITLAQDCDAFFEATEWAPASQSQGEITSIARAQTPSGEVTLFAGATKVAGVTLNGAIGRWAGTAVTLAGSGLTGGGSKVVQVSDGVRQRVYGLAEAAGEVAEWNGTGWSRIGDAVGVAVHDVAWADVGNGPELFAAGAGLHRWNGHWWVTGGSAALTTLSAVGQRLYYSGNATNWLEASGGGSVFDAPVQVVESASFKGSVHLGGTFGGIFEPGQGYVAYNSTLGLHDGEAEGACGYLQNRTLQEGTTAVPGPIYALAPFDDGASSRLLIGGDYGSACDTYNIFGATGHALTYTNINLGKGVEGGPVRAVATGQYRGAPAAFVAGGFTEVEGQPGKLLAIWHRAPEWGNCATKGVPPKIAILSPVGSVTRQSSVTIVGNVDEPVTLTVNGLPITLAPDRSFSIASGPLSEGANRFYFEATDLTNRTSFLASELILDSIAPGLSFVSPASGARVFTATPQIRLALSDAGAGLDLSSLTLQFAGLGTAASCSARSDAAVCVPSAALPNGLVSATASISDLAGNTSTAGPLEFVVDSSVSSTSTTVVGTVVFEGGGAAANARVRVLGRVGTSSATAANGSFVLPVTGVLSDERIQIVAELFSGGQMRTALSSPLAPIPGGTTLAGTLTLHLACDLAITPDLFGPQPGLDGQVRAAAVFDTGSGPALYLGGSGLVATGSVPNAGLVRWTGEKFVVVPGSPTAPVRALAVFDDGFGPALYVGGSFTSAGGLSVSGLARFNGATWSDVGGGVQYEARVDPNPTCTLSAGSVYSLHVFDAGNGPALYVGGSFQRVGGTVGASQVARWTSAGWDGLGASISCEVIVSGSSSPVVYSLASYDSGSGPELYAGGAFASLGGIAVQNIARFSGGTWRDVGGGIARIANGTSYAAMVNALTVFDDGSGPELYAAGLFTSAGSTAALSIARWNGSGWSAVGDNLGVYYTTTQIQTGVEALAVFDDGGRPALFAAGKFSRTGSNALSFIARLAGGRWVSPGVGISTPAEGGMVLLPWGEELVVGGSFASAGGFNLRNVARWNGTGWRPFGRGLDGDVYAAATFDDGVGPALYVGGSFRSADGKSLNRVARWTGNSFEPLGTGVDSTVLALEAYDDGTGSALYVGGAFANAGGLATKALARWDGWSWQPVGGGPAVSAGSPFVRALDIYDDGSGPALYVGGEFTSAGGVAASNIARWSSTGWSALSSGTNSNVFALAHATINGSTALFVGGSFSYAGGVPAVRVARWNGSWSALGTGLSNDVFALAPFNGQLLAGGDFTNFARSWNGATWSTSLGSGGPTSVVRAVEPWNDGPGLGAFFGGAFTQSGSASDGIARWNGSSWSSVAGTGVNSGGWVFALTTSEEATGAALYLGGNFTSVNGLPSSRIARWSRPLVCNDTAGPTVTIVEPTPGSTVTDPRPSIRATAVDSRSAVDATSGALSVDGAALPALCTFVGNELSCWLEADLPQGTHTLGVGMRDVVGNLGSASATITVDSLSPAVEFYDPIPEAILPIPTPTIRFRFLDSGSGIDPTTVAIRTQAGVSLGFSCSYDATGGECTAAAPIADTRFTLFVTVADLGGNRTDEASASYFVDTAPPAISVAIPADGAVLFTAPSAIALDFHDAGSGIDPASLQLTLDGVSLASSCTMDDARATCPVAALSPGAHAVAASIADRADRRSQTATSSFELTPDATPPVLVFVTPASGSIFDPQVTPFELAWSDAGSGVDGASLVVFSNGQATTPTCSTTASGMRCRIAQKLGGPVTLRALVRDLAGNLSAPAEVSFTVPVSSSDSTPPGITLVEPTGDTHTNLSPLSIRGLLSERATLTVDGVQVAVFDDRTFTAQVALSQGLNAIALVATDLAGNVGELTLEVVFDTTSPPGLDDALLTIGPSLQGEAPFGGAPGCVLGTESELRVLARNRTSGAVAMVAVAADRSFAGLAPALPGDEVEFVVVDAAGNESTAALRAIGGSVPVPLDPDPSEFGTAVESPFCRAYSFLWSGSAPVQFAVAQGALDCQRVSVVRGRIVDRTGQPIAGVRVAAPHDLGAGVATSRADGWFDFAVNGGGATVVDLRHEGYLPLQRTLELPWGSIRALAEIVLTAKSAISTTLDLASLDEMQVARGELVIDSAGSRRASLLVPRGTVASARLPGGGSQQLSTVTVRATEFTVGAGFERALPGPLPAGMDPSFVVELAIDEAEALGATRVELGAPVPFYVENFLDLPTGVRVAAASWSSETSSWAAEADGLVIEVLGESSGEAWLDVDGSGSPAGSAALAQIGIGAAELRTLAALFAPGDKLIRGKVGHLTPWYWGMGYLIRRAAEQGPPVELPPPSVADERRTSNAGLGAFGGLIDAENGILGQVLDVAGTGAALQYWSDRVPGRKAAYRLQVPLTGPTLPAWLERIDLTVEIGGRRIEQSFAPAPGLSTTIEWDGLDAYDRLATGPTDWTVELGYVHSAEFGGTLVSDRSFAGPFGRRTDYRPSRGEVRQLQVTRGVFTPFDAGEAFGLGGWGLDLLHRYDPLSKTLFFGTGDRRVWGGGPDATELLVRVAGNGVPGLEGDDGPARQALLAGPHGVWPTRDGGLLIADTSNCRVRKVDRYGTIHTVAGTDCSDPEGATLGDGGPATEAHLFAPLKAVEGVDGEIFVADAIHDIVRRIDPDTGIISTFFDRKSATCDGDLGDLALDGAGNLYVMVRDFMGDDRDPCAGVWKVSRQGEAIQLHGAFDQRIPTLVAVTAMPDGRVAYIRQQCIYEISASGVAPQTVAELVLPASDSGLCRPYLYGSDSYFRGDGQPASSNTRYYGPSGLAIAEDTTTYVADTLNQRIRVIRPDKMVETLVGGGSSQLGQDGLRAKSVSLNGPVSVALSPDGTSIYFSDLPSHTVWKLVLSAPVEDQEYEIPSENGAVIYVFDVEGHHLRTEDGLSRLALWSFEYETYPSTDPNGRPRKLVTEVRDAYGNAITVQRSGGGNAVAIASPFGQRTELAIGASGYLESVSRPGQAGVETVALTHRPDGLLESLQDPNGGLYEYQWDELGRLARVDDAANGSVTLSLINDNADGREIAATSAMGRSGARKVEFLPQREQQFTSRDSVGLPSTLLKRKDGSFEQHSPLDVNAFGVTTPDPQLGGLVTEWLSTTSEIAGSHTVTSSRETVAREMDPSDPFKTALRTERYTVNGRSSTVSYDGSQQTVTTTSPEGRTAISHFDEFGRTTQVDAPTVESVRTSYDAFGRVERVEQGSGATLRQTAYGYDPASGFLASVTDTLGRTTSLERDATGRVTKQVLPDLREIAFSYDLNGNVTSITPPTRPAHDFAYTQIDQVEAYTPPDVGFAPRQTSYGYNDDGQPTTITRPDGQQIVYTYETNGRTDFVTLPSGTIDVSYDGSGRVGSIAAPSGVGHTLAYDGPLVTSMSTTGPVPGAVSFTYSSHLELESRTINGASSVSFGYDDDGLLIQAGALSLARAPLTGFLTGTTLGVTSDSRSFTTFGELDTFSADLGGGGPFSYDLDRDGAGRITKKTETIAGVTNVWEYTYHPQRGWLTEVRKDGVVVETFGYDDSGNRTSFADFWGTGTAGYDDQDRMLTYGSKAFTHTANGELLSKIEGPELTSYEYDVRGALLGVDLPSGIQIDYLVDASGRRIGKKVNGTLVKGWLYAAGLAPVAETDGAGNVTTTFVYGTKVNVPEYFSRGSNNLRIFTDHLGSVRLVVNTSDGSIVQRIDYDAFGRVILDTSPGFQPFGFAGGLYDPQTGLTRFGARDYDPESGRWTAKDPIGFAGGSAGLYEYCGNDPVNRVDPSGLWSWDDTQLALDGIGLIPGLGEIADFANAGISFARGNYGDAALSVAAMVPVLGSIATGAKGLRHLDELGSIARKVEFNIAPHRLQPRPSSPVASHHGVQRRYLERNVPGFDANDAPTIMMRDGAGSPHRRITGEQASARARRRATTGNPYSGDYGQWRAESIEQMMRNGVPESKIGQWVLEQDGYLFGLGN